jgi:eukaryotic-like serine/threonine-protein kinase
VSVKLLRGIAHVSRNTTPASVVDAAVSTRRTHQSLALAAPESAPRIVAARRGSLADFFPSSARARLGTGSAIGRKYTLLHELGGNDFAVVFAARRTTSADELTLKILRPEFAGNAAAAARFSAEAQLGQRLRSERLPRVLGIDALPDGTPFVVMEALTGKSLPELIERSGRLPPRVAVDYALQACEALAVGHQQQLAHLELKPENLFLADYAGPHERLMLLDFGLASAVGAHAQPSAAASYMSPELLRSRKLLDARSDIWSLGCVLYWLLTGGPAFELGSLTESCAAILESEPAPARSLVPELPHALEALLRRCLHKLPEQRYQHVAELAQALSPFASTRAAAAISVERCRSLLGLEASALAELAAECA